MTDGMDDTESRLARIERLVERGEHEVAPAWRRATHGEPRWAVTGVILVAVCFQLMLPHRLTFQPYWALPFLELVLLAGLIAANPRQVEPRTRWLRWLGLVLICVISLANGLAAVRLVAGLVDGTEGLDAGPLLLTGGGIWLTNVIVFALWYWEWDAADRWRGPRSPPVRRLPLRTDAEPGDRAAGMGTGVPGLPVPVVHQLHRLQPDRRDAAVALGQDADDAAVLGLPGDRGPGGRPGRQHPARTGLTGRTGVRRAVPAGADAGGVMSAGWCGATRWAPSVT